MAEYMRDSRPGLRYRPQRVSTSSLSQAYDRFDFVIFRLSWS